MCGVPSTLLVGEVVRLALEVYNLGQVPLNSLRLSTSLGPCLLLDTVRKRWRLDYTLVQASGDVVGRDQ